jgi:uncharacterized protein
MGNTKKIWIDLDNSPHVPFFKPIINELQKRGFSLVITARDCFQVKDLAELMNLECRTIGRHYGKNIVLKVVGLLARTIQLATFIKKEKPDLAVSHGSRGQLLTANILRVPALQIDDYEHSDLTIKPTWFMVPEVIPVDRIPMPKDKIFQYPGIKEDVYASNFAPEEGLRASLDIADNDLMITIRPPATEAHYHNPESDELLKATIDRMGKIKSVRMVLLPRNDNQEHYIRNMWPELINAGKLIMPAKVVDGLNLIWHSDLVVSGGGTMNREAAALGVPVYSIFKGKIGAVDRYLADHGRLVLLENAADVREKVKVERRNRSAMNASKRKDTLTKIVNQIALLAENSNGH